MDEKLSESDLRAQRDLLATLQKHEGFGLFRKALAEDMNLVTNQIMQPLKAQDEVLGEQYNKGLLKGLIFSHGWVESRLKAINEDLDLFERKRNVEDAERNY